MAGLLGPAPGVKAAPCRGILGPAQSTAQISESPMADQKQIARLRESVAAWTRWRENNLGVHLDFREANLRGADLSGANLSHRSHASRFRNVSAILVA